MFGNNFGEGASRKKKKMGCLLDYWIEWGVNERAEGGKG